MVYDYSMSDTIMVQFQFDYNNADAIMVYILKLYFHWIHTSYFHLGYYSKIYTI